MITQITDWLFANESAISALAGLLAITVIIFMPLRALVRGLVKPKPADELHTFAELTADASMPNKPSLVVLPFDDLSDENSRQALVDGFTEDLTTLLARIPGFFVTARNTAFTYRGDGSGRDVRAIGRDLNVRYVLEGSIRPMGETTRVTAQLIDASSGTHLWADRFDRPSADLHDTLDLLAQQIGLQLGSELTRAEASLAERRPPEDQNAWALYQRAKSIPMTQGWSVESFSQISELLHRAIEAEPEFAPSHAYLSLMLAIGHWVQLVERPQEAHDNALSHGERALELEPNSSEVLGWVGCAMSDLGYHSRGVPLIEKAIELNPSNAQAFAALGAAQVQSGDLVNGIAQLEHAIELSPRDAGYAPWSTLLSFGQSLQGNEEKSMFWAQSACKSHARYFPAQIALARALAKRGETKQAAAALAEAKRQFPKLGRRYIDDFVGQWASDDLLVGGVDPDLIG